KFFTLRTRNSDRVACKLVYLMRGPIQNMRVITLKMIYWTLHANENIPSKMARSNLRFLGFIRYHRSSVA
ncbi:hypothetical protein L9F63_000590, partial [Diploptera punctata]